MNKKQTITETLLVLGVFGIFYAVMVFLDWLIMQPWGWLMIFPGLAAIISVMLYAFSQVFQGVENARR